MFYENSDLKNFAKLTEKRPHRSIYFNKLPAQRPGT